MLLRFRPKAAYVLAIALSLFQGRSAFSGIMLDGVPESEYFAYANQSQFNAIGSFNTGTSGTLIAPNWVLTAGHVGAVSGFQVRGNGTVYGVAEVIQHPTFLANGQDINFGYDLELVRLTTDVAGVTPATIYRGTSEAGSTVSITGFGYGGNGSGTNDLPPAQRAGTNVIDTVISFPDKNGKTGAQSAMLIADFDSGSANFNTLSGLNSSATPTGLEYHLAGFDSGGGVFIFENGQWYLVGVNSGVDSQQGYFDSKDAALSDKLFGYGAISYITRVSSFTGFIDSNITAVPEPTSLALVGLAAGCLIGKRFLRRRAL